MRNSENSAVCIHNYCANIQSQVKLRTDMEKRKKKRNAFILSVKFLADGKMSQCHGKCQRNVMILRLNGNEK